MDDPHVQKDIHLHFGSIFHCYVSLPECIYVKPYTNFKQKTPGNSPGVPESILKTTLTSIGKQKHWAHWLAPEPIEPSTDAKPPEPRMGCGRKYSHVGQNKQSLNCEFKINKLLHTHIFIKYTPTKKKTANGIFLTFLGGDVLCFFCLSGLILTLRMETQHTWKSPRSSPNHIFRSIYTP